MKCLTSIRLDKTSDWVVNRGHIRYNCEYTRVAAWSLIWWWNRCGISNRWVSPELEKSHHTKSSKIYRNRMVKGWSKSWFGHFGTSVLVTLPFVLMSRSKKEKHRVFMLTCYLAMHATMLDPHLRVFYGFCLAQRLLRILLMSPMFSFAVVIFKSDL